MLMPPLAASLLLALPLGDGEVGSHPMRVAPVGLQGIQPATTAKDVVSVTPLPYDRALRNPLKGFTANVDGSHEWATLAHRYFKWNELENDISDGIGKILAVSDAKFGDAHQHNIKVIPRVYLHWSADHEKYWPADMTTDSV